jgi:hypothetical protein
LKTSGSTCHVPESVGTFSAESVAIGYVIITYHAYLLALPNKFLDLGRYARLIELTKPNIPRSSRDTDGGLRDTVH